MSSQGTPTLDGLAAEISQLTGAITSHLRANSLPEPSFLADSPADRYDLPPPLAGARMVLLGKVLDLYHLTMGPREQVMFQSALVPNDAVVLDLLNKFDFYGAVPLDGSASYAEIAHAGG
jgi:hypothetical protein